MVQNRCTEVQDIDKSEIYSGFQAKSSNPALPTKRVKEVKRSLFQSFQKPAKNVVKPANPRIRRFFAFKAVFKLYKNAHNFYGRIVAQTI
ncbi:hypothetical protein B0A65_18180 [Flavobacterium frigidimaris]|uniref:Transposase n=1 Tax=Flavobacterium frigidimaris TaxID=262320 RepID=A0ABX4BMD8_FLAFR|nr:hypothetical protein B0A65_18180 [Flavobacterium frigidimaris]